MDAAANKSVASLLPSLIRCCCCCLRRRLQARSSRSNQSFSTRRGFTSGWRVFFPLDLRFVCSYMCTYAGGRTPGELKRENVV